MAASTVIKQLHDGIIDLEDGTTPTAVTLTVPFSVGDLSVSGLQQTQRAVTKYETRGVFNSARLGGRTYPTGSFSAHLADYSDGTEQTLIDFFLAQASFSANVSTLGANAEVYAVKITLTVEGSDHGDTADHTIVMDDCVCTLDTSEGEPNTVSVNFEVLGTIAFT